VCTARGLETTKVFALMRKTGLFNMMMTLPHPGEKPHLLGRQAV